MSDLWTLASRREAEQQADRLTSRFPVAPIDVHAIAGSVGIHSVTVDDIADPARLEVGPILSTWAVVLRRTDATVRQRFSIAHEIGHVVLKVIEDETRYRGVAAARSSRSPGEQLCDYFAGALLIPRTLLVEAMKTTSVLELPRRFDVSQDAMRIRLEHLGLRSAANQL